MRRVIEMAMVAGALLFAACGAENDSVETLVSDAIAQDRPRSAPTLPPGCEWVHGGRVGDPPVLVCPTPLPQRNSDRRIR